MQRDRRVANGEAEAAVDPQEAAAAQASFPMRKSTLPAIDIRLSQVSLTLCEVLNSVDGNVPRSQERVLRSADAAVGKIADALPAGTLLVVATGHGDTSLVRRLQARSANEPAVWFRSQPFESPLCG